MGYLCCFILIGFDYCQVKPCKNAGVCINRPNGYTCMCPPGAEGRQCQNSECILLYFAAAAAAAVATGGRAAAGAVTGMHCCVLLAVDAAVVGL